MAEQEDNQNAEVAKCPDRDPPCDWYDRRKDHNEWCHQVDRRLDEGAALMDALCKELAENTTATKQAQADASHTKKDTKELVELLNSFKGAFHVLEMIGKTAKPIGFIAAGIAGVIGAFKAVVGILSIFKGGGPAP